MQTVGAICFQMQMFGAVNFQMQSLDAPNFHVQTLYLKTGSAKSCIWQLPAEEVTLLLLC